MFMHHLYDYITLKNAKKIQHKLAFHVITTDAWGERPRKLSGDI
jgi:hypothetical protein